MHPPDALAPRRPLAHRYSLELLQLTHQLGLLLGGHAGEDSALDQDLSV